MIYILGKNSYIANSILNGYKCEDEIIVMNVNKFLNDNINFNGDRNIYIIDSTGVSRGTENEFFDINFHDKQKIVERIINFKKVNSPINFSYIFMNSIHRNQNTIYGYSKRYMSFLMKKYLVPNNINCTDIVLNSIYGEKLVPNKYSVVATFLYNIKNNIKSEINPNNPKIIISHVVDLLKELKDIINVSNVKGYQERFIDGVEITINDLYRVIESIVESNPSLNERDFYKELHKNIRGNK